MGALFVLLMLTVGFLYIYMFVVEGVDRTNRFFIRKRVNRRREKERAIAAEFPYIIWAYSVQVRKNQKLNIDERTITKQGDAVQYLSNKGIYCGVYTRIAAIHRKEDSITIYVESVRVADLTRNNSLELHNNAIYYNYDNEELILYLQAIKWSFNSPYWDCGLDPKLEQFYLRKASFEVVKEIPPTERLQRSFSTTKHAEIYKITGQPIYFS